MKKDENKEVFSTEKENMPFPGYPTYPAKEDITRAGNNKGRVILNMENNPVPQKTEEKSATDNDIIMGTEADVTAEDKELLDLIDNNRGTQDSINFQHADLDEIDEDGELLNENIESDDLDIPGSELDDADENIGEEDEENNYYSLGGDNHEAQEEN
jgi:hypothetical protein